MIEWPPKALRQDVLGAMLCALVAKVGHEIRIGDEEIEDALSNHDYPLTPRVAMYRDEPARQYVFRVLPPERVHVSQLRRIAAANRTGEEKDA